MVHGADFSSAGLQLSEEKIDKQRNSDCANYVIYFEEIEHNLAPKTEKKSETLIDMKIH